MGEVTHPRGCEASVRSPTCTAVVCATTETRHLDRLGRLGELEQDSNTGSVHNRGVDMSGHPAPCCTHQWQHHAAQGIMQTSLLAARASQCGWEARFEACSEPSSSSGAHRSLLRAPSLDAAASSAASYSSFGSNRLSRRCLYGCLDAPLLASLPDLLPRLPRLAGSALSSTALRRLPSGIMKGILAAIRPFIGSRVQWTTLAAQKYCA